MIDWSSLVPEQFGWVQAPDEVDRVLESLPIPVATRDVMADIRDSGKGKVAPLHLVLAKVRPGGFPVLAQEIGDCVGNGYAAGCMLLKAKQTEIRPEQWVADVAVEPIYGGSRVEIGGGRIGGDGSVGAWAAKYVQDYGILLRQKYGNVDLTTYSGRASKEWGRRGVPDELEPIAREHPVKTATLVTTYDDARDAIYNGYPVVVCSMQGFTMQRDQDGFARPSGSWPHCMYFCAADDEFKRPGLLCMNSWGPDWISGPKRLDQPDGSFWVDAEVVNRMLRERDSFLLSELVGFPRQSIDWDVLWR